MSVSCARKSCSNRLYCSCKYMRGVYVKFTVWVVLWIVIYGRALTYIMWTVRMAGWTFLLDSDLLVQTVYLILGEIIWVIRRQAEDRELETFCDEDPCCATTILLKMLIIFTKFLLWYIVNSLFEGCFWVLVVLFNWDMSIVKAVETDCSWCYICNMLLNFRDVR